MERSMDKRCASCLFWDGLFGDSKWENKGKCRRSVKPIHFPFYSGGLTARGRIDAVFPPVTAGDWCGDFEAEPNQGNSGY